MDYEKPPELARAEQAALDFGSALEEVFNHEDLNMSHAANVIGNLASRMSAPNLFDFAGLLFINTFCRAEDDKEFRVNAEWFLSRCGNVPEVFTSVLLFIHAFLDEAAAKEDK